MENIIIERLGHHGDGIAQGPVFVPRTLPGEVVAGLVENNRIAAPKIVTPVAERVRPPCTHYKSCGGCAVQHASDEFVARWKKSVVEVALSAQGLVAPVRRVITSPPYSRRRATLTARRLKRGAQVGFNGLRSDTITEIPDCHLLRPEIVEMLPFVRDLARIGGSRKARLAVTLTLLDDGMDISVSGGKGLTRELFSALVAACAEVAGIARLSWGGELLAAFSPARLTLGKARISPPPGAFLQATAEGERALVASVTEAVQHARHVADLFAGCGTFSLPLSEKATIHAVESTDEMLAALSEGWRNTSGLKEITTEPRDLFRQPLLPDELNRFDAVVLDPPRAGAEAQVAEICRSEISHLAMVSCNPITFARDVKALAQAGFAISWIDVVDQFRWSSHVELVASLSRR